MSPHVALHPRISLHPVGTTSNRTVVKTGWAVKVEIISVSKLHCTDCTVNVEQYLADSLDPH